MSFGETFASTLSTSFSGDNTADGVHGQLMHPARLWCPDVDMLELILRGDLALTHFRDFGTRVAKLLGRFAPRILVNLNDLQFHLGDPAGGRRPGGDQRPALACQTCRIAFEGGHASEGDEVFVLLRGVEGLGKGAEAREE